MSAHTEPAFTLNDFTRVAWASSRARDVWAPRIARITAAWEQIERWSVVDHLRPSALQSIEPATLCAVSTWASARGAVALPLSRAGAQGTYSASTAPMVDGQPWTYRIAITRAAFAPVWVRAWAEGDDDLIGSLLGFPDCCRAFFARTWGAGSVDPTGHMAASDRPGRLAANSLLRWLGVRLVPHLPCRFDCAATAALGLQFEAIGRAHGFLDEVRWIEEMLDWPMEWSALHGVAEVRTPVLKIATRTDYTSDVQTIRRVGGQYPAEGASGNDFPYQRPAEVKPITLHRSFKAAFTDAADWTENGFSSREAMVAAHSMVLNALATDPPAGTVLDLGCGNGLLLKTIAARFGCQVRGIEKDPAKAREPWIKIGDLVRLDEHSDDPVDTILVSRRRFEEMPSLERWARDHCRQVLVYSYDVPMYAFSEAVR